MIAAPNAVVIILAVFILGVLLHFTVVVKDSTWFRRWLAKVDSITTKRMGLRTLQGIFALSMGIWLVVDPRLGWVVLLAWPLIAIGLTLTVACCAMWTARPAARRAFESGQLVRIDESVMTLFSSHLQANSPKTNFAHARRWVIRYEPYRLASLHYKLKLMNMPKTKQPYAPAVARAVQELFEEYKARHK